MYNVYIEYMLDVGFLDENQVLFMSYKFLLSEVKCSTKTHDLSTKIKAWHL